MAKLVKYLSVDRIYCNTAILVNKLCKKLESIYPRDLNVHLSWVILTLIVLFVTFIVCNSLVFINFPFSTHIYELN